MEALAQVEVIWSVGSLGVALPDSLAGETASGLVGGAVVKLANRQTVPASYRELSLSYVGTTAPLTARVHPLRI